MPVDAQSHTQAFSAYRKRVCVRLWAESYSPHECMQYELRAVVGVFAGIA